MRKCGEHQVELTHLSPVLGTGDGADDATVDDDVTQPLQVVGIQRLRHAGANLVHLLPVAQHVGIGGTELLLVEALAELAAAFLDLLGYLLLQFCDVVLDKHVGTVTLLGVLVVDKRVIEGTHMAGG